jgi:hypothetical protein
MPNPAAYTNTERQFAIEWREEKPGENCHQKLITIKSGGEKSSQRENCPEELPQKPERRKKYVECPTMGTNMNTTEAYKKKEIK